MLANKVFLNKRESIHQGIPDSVYIGLHIAEFRDSERGGK